MFWLSVSHTTLISRWLCRFRCFSYECQPIISLNISTRWISCGRPILKYWLSNKSFAIVQSDGSHYICATNRATPTRTGSIILSITSKCGSSCLDQCGLLSMLGRTQRLNLSKLHKCCQALSRDWPVTNYCRGPTSANIDPCSSIFTGKYDP